MAASDRPSRLIGRERARIRRFAKTELGQLAGCSGACDTCGSRMYSCSMNVELRRLYGAAWQRYVDDLCRLGRL